MPFENYTIKKGQNVTYRLIGDTNLRTAKNTVQAKNVSAPSLAPPPLPTVSAREGQGASNGTPKTSPATSMSLRDKANIVSGIGMLSTPAGVALDQMFTAGLSSQFVGTQRSLRQTAAEIAGVASANIAGESRTARAARRQEEVSRAVSFEDARGPSSSVSSGATRSSFEQALDRERSEKDFGGSGPGGRDVRGDGVTGGGR